MQSEQAELLRKCLNSEAETLVGPSDRVLDCNLGEEWLGEHPESCSSHQVAVVDRAINKIEYIPFLNWLIINTQYKYVK